MTRELVASQMLVAAEKETGLADWGDALFREPLDVLLADLNGPARLRPDGFEKAARRLHDILCTRLQWVNDRKRFPGIAAEEIRRPVFVLGLPRAGTTFFHNILSHDPANRSPLTWEIMYPSPPPEPATYASDPRIARAAAAMEFEGFMAPELQVIHPFGALRPEECNFMWEISLLTVNFSAWWNVPNYAKLLGTTDFHAVYREHRQFLQQLQHRFRGERWVLKSPAHNLWIEALLEVYPDALFVQCHRDPAKIVPSLSKNLVVWRKTFSDEASISEYGQKEMLASGLANLDRVRARPGFADRFFDAHYLEVQADPLGVLKRAYAQFGLPLPAANEAAIAGWLAADRSDHAKGPRHTYALEDYDLDYAQIDRVFGDYVARHRVALER